MYSARWVLCVVLAVLLALGPGVLLAAPRLNPKPQKPAGVIFVVGGVGGLDVLGASAHAAFPRAGLHHEIRDFIWTHGFGMLFKDLQDSRHLRQKAEELAEQIRQYQASHPGKPIYIVAKSGGTGLALLAAEMLPAGSLERIILLSAAVSPDYDLRPALRTCKNGIVSFYSRHDQVILNWGTRQFGTVDRVYGPSAGLRGFQVPDRLSPADRSLYQRLVQIPWNPRMILEGHTGAHAGTSFPAFLRVEVAPWLR